LEILRCVRAVADATVEPQTGVFGVWGGIRISIGVLWGWIDYRAESLGSVVRDGSVRERPRVQKTAPVGHRVPAS